MENLYSTLLWRIRRAQAIERDGHRCTVSRWLGGACAPGPLHVHHIHPVAEGGDPYDLDNLGTVCAAHHPTWEALRRLLVAALFRQNAPPPRCPHRHPTEEGRRICEAERARSVAA